MDMEKIFFSEGDIVQVKHDIDNKPTMLVQKIDKTVMGERPRLLGVTCIWFTTTGELQQHRFNTKDIERC